MRVVGVATCKSTTAPCSDGGEWKRLRSALGRPMVPRRLLDYVPRLERTAEVFLEIAEDGASANRDGFTEDALQLVQRWAMEGEPIASTVCVRVCVCSGLVCIHQCMFCMCGCENGEDEDVLFITLCAYVHCLPNMVRGSKYHSSSLSVAQ